MSRGLVWWDKWFINFAKYVSSASYDPSTKTGSVIVDEDKRVVSVGYNGFARGVYDDQERYADRDLKMKIIIHCEENAIIFSRRSLKNCTLYTYPFMSCSKCASLVINSGITRCVAPVIPEHLKERWEKDMNLSRQLFVEAGVELCEYEKFDSHE